MANVFPLHPRNCPPDDQNFDDPNPNFTAAATAAIAAILLLTGFIWWVWQAWRLVVYLTRT